VDPIFPKDKASIVVQNYPATANGPGATFIQIEAGEFYQFK
jgi:hypothetical protein